MKITYTILISIFTLFLSLNSANAQGGTNRKGDRSGGGRGSNYSRMYDTNAVETITGSVTKVERMTATKGRSCGLHILVATDQETITVHLGPEWYFDKKDFEIENGDSLAITGSRIEYEGNPAIIASKLKIGEQTHILRSDDGIPVWSGWKRQQSYLEN